jgi:hypothetical protein
LPDAGQRVLQAVSRLHLAPIAPQQARQPFARLRRSGIEGKDGKQGAILLARQVRDPAIGQLQSESPEQGEIRHRHEVYPGAGPSPGPMHAPERI